MRLSRNIPITKIETDSYIAVQLIENNNSVDITSIADMAETVDGSFVFTILRNDDTMFLVKGSNPLTLYHYEELGLYVYASTVHILQEALKKSGFKLDCKEVVIDEGEIIQIDSEGKIQLSEFMSGDSYYSQYDYDCYDEDEYFDTLKSMCKYYGVTEEYVDCMRWLGYTYDEIEERIMYMN